MIAMLHERLPVGLRRKRAPSLVHQRSCHFERIRASSLRADAAWRLLWDCKGVPPLLRDLFQWRPKNFPHFKILPRFGYSRVIRKPYIVVVTAQLHSSHVVEDICDSLMFKPFSNDSMVTELKRSVDHFFKR